MDHISRSADIPSARSPDCPGALRATIAADGCAVHTPPKQGIIDPPFWTSALYARRHHVENLFSRMKDSARIARRRHKTRRSWMGFANFNSAMTALRLAEFNHRP